MLRKNKYANVVINKGALILEHLQRRSTWKWLITMPRVILLCRCIMGKTHLERLPSFLPSFSSIRVRGKRLKIAVIVEKTFKFVIFHSIWGFEAGCKFVESLWHLGISLKTSSVRYAPMRIGNRNRLGQRTTADWIEPAVLLRQSLTPDDWPVAAIFV